MFENREGQRIPQATFKMRRDGDWLDVTTGDIFAGRTVVVFSLPGAFTPTCSSAHVPRFNELAGVFRDNGVDDIVCVSVNDAFVMNEWAREQGAANVTFVPDGNGEFTRGMGMLVDRGELGFGMRSWRYSMLVRDGVIDKMFIEPDVPGDPYQVSDADTMLDYINPNAERPLDVVVFTRQGCPFCARAKSLLRERDIEFEEITLGGGAVGRSVRAVSGSNTVPQVFVDGRLVGDSQALESWLQAQQSQAA
ncbi:MAG: glutathione peroxidase [Thiogranum sp.]